MNMKHLWNATDRAKLKYSETNRNKCHFADHQYHTDCPGIEPIFGGREAGDKPPETRHSHEFDYMPLSFKKFTPLREANSK
jgi:hypothetical protein